MTARETDVDVDDGDEGGGYEVRVGLDTGGKLGLGKLIVFELFFLIISLL